MSFFGTFLIGILIGTSLGILIAYLLIELGKYIAIRKGEISCP